MSIIIDKDTKLVVSGLTGREGSFHGLRNKAYGTDLVAGVTPGKAGQDVEGIPVFNTVRDAVEATDTERGEEAIEMELGDSIANIAGFPIDIFHGDSVGEVMLRW